MLPVEQPEERDAAPGDPTADVAVRRAALAAALARLDDDDRELVGLKFQAGLANAEIGAVLGISESNVGTRLSRAVAKLREEHGMTDDPQLEELARDLHAIRAEPDPDFARELDRRAAGWLREGERRRRLPSLRIVVAGVRGRGGARDRAGRRRRGVERRRRRSTSRWCPRRRPDAAGGEALSAPAPQARARFACG